METTVVIIGAGCSKPYGYPLAREFKQQLEEFGQSVASAAPRLAGLVTQTASLFRQLQANGIQVETLDELAWHLHQEVLNPYPQNLRLIEDAKLAVAAFFMAKESAAVKSGLSGYRSWMKRIFSSHGTSPRQALKNSPYRVLSFNYDRLFELAFRQFFNWDDTIAFYGPEGLNSGLCPVMPGRVEVTPNRFSLLKLHGSVGVYSFDQLGECEHIHELPDLRKTVNITDDRFFVPNAAGYGIHSNQPKPALIVFPHEKDLLIEYPSNALSHRTYIPAIWKAARSMTSEASEMWIVGYSCPETDFPALQSLLIGAANCKRIVIQNPSAKAICDRLKVRLPRLKNILEPYDQPFENA